MIPLLIGLLTLMVMQSSSSAQSLPSDATGRAQAILAAIRDGEFAKVEEQFTDEMKRALPPGRLEATWTLLLKQTGAFKTCGTEVRVRDIADKRMVITPCEFERAKIDIQFAFDSAARVSGLVFRPAADAAVAYTVPPYANSASYAEAEVTVGTDQGGLPGTLTLPTGAPRVPAIVLVHGSGPHDRDETIGANKPFRDLATGLASRGVAVLRYDKRTRVHAGKMSAVTDLTVAQEVIEDVLHAVKLLRAHPRIDPVRVFVLGHSLGGMLLPRIGVADPTLAGLIVMAGPARSLDDAIVAQTRYLAAADGTISPDEQRAIDQATDVAESVRALKPEDARSGRMIFGAPASYWLDLRNYDAPAAAVPVKMPILIIQGERDYQVTVEEFRRWKAMLDSRRDVTFRSYPDLNHLFIAGTGPSLPAEYQLPGRVAAEVIRDLSAWIIATR